MLPSLKTGVEERAHQVRQGWRLGKSALHLEVGGKKAREELTTPMEKQQLGRDGEREN